MSLFVPRKVFKEQAKTKNEVKGEASAPQLQNLTLEVTHGNGETGIDNFDYKITSVLEDVGNC